MFLIIDFLSDEFSHSDSTIKTMAIVVIILKDIRNNPPRKVLPSKSQQRKTQGIPL